MSLYSQSTYDRVKKLAPIVARSVGRSLSGAEIEALAREAATSAPSSQRDQVLWLRGRLGGGPETPLPTQAQAVATVAAQQAAGPPRAITPPGGAQTMSLVTTTRAVNGGAPAVSSGLFGTIGGILKGAAGGLLAGGPVGGILGGIAGGIGASSGGQAVPTSPPIAPGGGTVAGLGGVFPTVPMPPQQAPTTRRTIDLTPLPGAIYTTETTQARPALPAGPSMEPPSGYKLNKTSYFLRDGTFVPKGTRWVKVRRRNAMNPRALSRAIARVDSAKRWQSRLSGITTRKYSSSGSRKKC